MTKTALLKLLLAIVMTFILTLPDYFKTPKGNILELSCLEMCLPPNLTYSFSSLNFSVVTFLQRVRETQTLMEIFLNHSNVQNFTRICHNSTSEFKMCLVCESKGNMDFISQEQTSKVLIMRGSMEAKANYLLSPCRHFNLTVAPAVDHLEEYNFTYNPKPATRSSAVMEEEPTKEKSMNHTCGIMNYSNNCVYVSLHVEMDAKNFFCPMKITWYVLVILVFILVFLLTLIEVHRQGQKWQSHKYRPSSVPLRSDSEKPRAMEMRVISAGTKQRLPSTQVKVLLSPIPELDVPSTTHQHE
uniref:Transmembrane protein 156 n=1 Tax=Pipistrellus kuhlii TaxID=59472 RepID=A0A7J8B5Y0_PIPKU|nr:transmembrane protein 156 [Pipistrellus kuhlii]